MTKEELMKPRVIVENKWPGCKFEVGDILYKDDAGDYVPLTGTSWLTKEDVEPYPYLMRPLPWYAERKAEEMPQHVWYDKSGFDKKPKLVVLSVKQWHIEPDGDIWAEVENDFIGYATVHMPKPATEPEYTTYLSKQH